MADFEKAFPLILENEGGLSNDPQDAGGITNMGITKQDLATYLDKPISTIPNDSIINLSLDLAKQIYITQYWNPMLLDQVTDQNAATVIFDCGVNMGPGTAIKFIQRPYFPHQDGVMGAQTLQRLNNDLVGNAVKNIMKGAIGRYTSIVQNNSTQIVFFTGWMNRVTKYLNYL